MFNQLHPVWQALLATLFTYGVTALGAAVVFFCKEVNQKILDLMMGFAAGVMIAASYWSLLSPAIEMTEQQGTKGAMIVSLGFLTGGFFVMLTDCFLAHAGQYRQLASLTTKKKRCILLTTAVTMHNIPEGMAVGVAFGSAAIDGSEASLIGALMLALGIGLQNFPEGTCVALPLRREGVGRKKCFFIGQMSGVVEPIAGLIGVLFALTVQRILPFVLAFSAGAMISVVCSELIPESFRTNKQAASIGVLLGFVVMMFLDVTLA